MQKGEKKKQYTQFCEILKLLCFKTINVKEVVISIIPCTCYEISNNNAVVKNMY